MCVCVYVCMLSANERERSGKIKGAGSCKFSSQSHTHPLNRHDKCRRIQARTNKHAPMLTTNFDVAVLPGCVWVGGKAPGPVAPVWVPAVVVIQAFTRIADEKKKKIF